MLRGGWHSGWGQPRPALQPSALAASSAARLPVTARGEQSIGQHSPASTRVKAQSAAVSQGESSDALAVGVLPVPFGAGSGRPPLPSVEAQARTKATRAGQAFTRPTMERGHVAVNREVPPFVTL